MKKYLELFFTVIVLSMFCACGREEADNIQTGSMDIADPMEGSDIIQEAEADVPVEDGTDINASVEDETEINAPVEDETEINTPIEGETAVLPEEEKTVYEAFLATNAGYGYLYAYFDYDNDDKQELYLRSDNYGQVWKYVGGGLKTIYKGNISEIYNINGLAWNEIEKNDSADTADSGERVHEGVYVYVEQNPYEERTEWYVEEQDFLSQYGFGESDPFYEYALPDGSMRMVLYYDEETGLGCGLRYYQRDPDEWTTSGIYGFSFLGANIPSPWDPWEDRLNVDYTKYESYMGTTVSDIEEENIEYDDAGRVAHYEAYASIDGEVVRILNMYYEYDDNGTLRQREYHHYHLQFGSTFQYWYSYFDELGRVEYERAYITHGSLEYYYIYTDERDEPAYSLYLDNNCGAWMPDFARF